MSNKRQSDLGVFFLCACVEKAKTTSQLTTATLNSDISGLVLEVSQREQLDLSTNTGSCELQSEPGCNVPHFRF